MTIQNYMKMNKGSFNYAIIPNRKNQDFVKIGEHENEYHWIVCCDGHGDDTFINIIRRLNWDFIMGHESSYDCLMKILETSTHLYNINSGSTLAMVKIYPTQIDSITIGDTPVIIYKNEHLVYKSPLHNLDNPIEKERIQKDGKYSVFYKYSAKIETFKKYRVSLLGYTTFNNDVSLSMTQSIGHQGVALYKPDTFKYNYDVDDNIRVIVGSDGFFDMWILYDESIKNPTHVVDSELDHIDMVTRNSSYLSEKVLNRWTQQWEHHWNPECQTDYQVNCFTSEDIDDISIVVWDNLK
jgi:serine/threonine protein phosphatase PrpC